MKILALVLMLALAGLSVASDEVLQVASETRRLKIENAMLRVTNLNLQAQQIQKALEASQKDLNDQVLGAAAEQKLNIDQYDFDFRSLVFRRKASPEPAK